MTARPDPLGRALAALRRRIAAGDYPPEHRFAAAELAGEFALSPTPIREVLARLAGEGLLEDRRGQGYFLRRLTGRDVAELYRLNLAYLRLALEPGGAVTGPATPAETADVLEAVDALFDAWMAAGSGRALSAAYLRNRLQLARVRRAEPRLIGDLVSEHAALSAAAADPVPARLAALRRFHARRIRIAVALAEAADAPAADPSANRL